MSDEPDPLRPAPSPDPDANGSDHDPTGLDLATQIAEAAAASCAGVVQPLPKRRRPGKRDAAKSRARRDDPTPLGRAVDALIAQRGWSKGVNVKAMLKDWPGLVGAANAEHSNPEAYIDKVLTIRADSTAWATSLRLLAPQLLARLNAELGQGTVTRVEILGPAGPSWKHGLRVVRDGRGPRDTYG